MLLLHCEKLQRRRTSKPIQTVEDIFEGLGFDNLVKPGIKVKMSTANKVFKGYAQIFNTKGGGKKAYAFDAHHILKSMCRTWVELKGNISSFREDTLREKSLFEQEIQKPSDRKDGRLRKLAGELEVSKKKLCKV